MIVLKRMPSFNQGFGADVLWTHASKPCDFNEKLFGYSFPLVSLVQDYD